MQALLERYFELLPQYQGVPLDQLTFRRVLFAGFPCYADGPLRPAFPRILQVATIPSRPVSVHSVHLNLVCRLAARHSSFCIEFLFFVTCDFLNPAMFIPQMLHAALQDLSMAPPSGGLEGGFWAGHGPGTAAIPCMSYLHLRHCTQDEQHVVIG